jgi:hypothetical protein
MIELCEITLSGRNRFCLKRTLAGAFYLELLRPGELRDGHGWIVSDSVFLEQEQTAKLRELLEPAPQP